MVSAVTLVTPRWDEPFGLVAAEAMACGTPVAAWASGALPEIVDDTTGRLAAPGDLEGLRRAVTQASGLDRAGVRRRVVERFDRRTMVDAYLRVYERLAGPRAA